MRTPIPITKPLLKPVGIIHPLLNDPALEALYIPNGYEGVDKLIDLSGNGRHGSLAGPLWRGGALSFDGDDYIDCGNFADLVTPNTPLSVFTYFKVGGKGSIETLISKRGYSGGNVGWKIEQTSETKLKFTIYGNGTANDVIPNHVLGINEIVSVCGVYNGTGNRSGMSMYIDGVFLLSGTAQVIDAPTTISANVFLGRDSANAMRYLIGDIYMVAIFSRELNASEVLTLHKIARGLTK